VKVFLGVDPGASGGMAQVWEDGGRIMCRVWKMPDTLAGVWDRIWEAREAAAAHVELVTGFQKGGGAGHPGSRMFNFGRGYGALLMALTATDVPFELVQPRTWQRSFGLGKEKGEADGAWKGRLKRLAQELFPDAGITLATADAALIAEHCRRTRAEAPDRP
jgi:hypothetical protein